MNYLLTLISIFSIGVILALSLNLIMGYSGRVTMAHAGFMGIGAYTSAWVSLNAGLDMWLALIVAAVVSGIIGWLFGLATMRIAGDEFILATFALQMVIVEAISRWTDVTRGTYGLSGIPKPEIFGIVLKTVPQYTLYVVVVMLICVFTLMRLVGSSYGLVLRGIRESESSMEALGTDTATTKITIMAISAGFAGIAGTLQASLITFIHPDNFSVMLSIIIVAYLLVGGIGNMWGAILGAVLLISIPELIAVTGIVPGSLLGPMERIVYGLILMLFVWFRPKGLIAERPILQVERMIKNKKIKVGELSAENR